MNTLIGQARTTDASPLDAFRLSDNGLDQSQLLSELAFGMCKLMISKGARNAQNARSEVGVYIRMYAVFTDSNCRAFPQNGLFATCTMHSHQFASVTRVGQPNDKHERNPVLKRRGENLNVWRTTTCDRQSCE